MNFQHETKIKLITPWRTISTLNERMFTVYVVGLAPKFSYIHLYVSERVRRRNLALLGAREGASRFFVREITNGFEEITTAEG